MSMLLPARMTLLADRELAHLHALVVQQHLPTEVLEAARGVARASLAELRTSSLAPDAIDAWSRKTLPSVLMSVAPLFKQASLSTLLVQLDQDLDLQRAELRAFLLPVDAAVHADFALVLVQLVLAAAQRDASQQAFESLDVAQLVARADAASADGAPLRIISFLTLALEDARSGVPVGSRHADYARLAFMDAVQLQRSLALTPAASAALDPVPFLPWSREDIARDALKRLASSTPDARTAAVLNELRRP